MKKHFIKVLSLCALLASQAMVYTSCGDDEDEATPNENNNPENGDTLKPVEHKATIAFFLNEGSPGKNNSTLDSYNTETGVFSGKVFTTANGEGLGDTGQDIIYYGGRMYLSVYGSKYLAKLDVDGKVIEKYEFSEAEGQPRFLESCDGFVYVSLYSGQVAKFDTTSIKKPVALVTVGSNPEGMCISNNTLYVANSGWGKDNRLSVIDLSTFTLTKNVELVNNLQDVKVIGDSVYVTYYDANYAVQMLNVDIAKNMAYEISAASKIAVNGDLLLCANSATAYDENWNATVNTNYYIRDTKTGKNIDLIDLAGHDELKTATVYLLDVDPVSGDIYLGTTDYKTNGTIYRFDCKGKFVSKVETSGINPNNAVFIF